jgi:hypothetical protein
VQIPPNSRIAGWWRQTLAGVLAAVLLGGIGWAFWRQDLQYALPTPRPAGWHRPAVATRVALTPDLDRLRASRPRRPLLLHFFNPSCPCSRFNVDHVRALASRFGDDVQFVAVLADGEPETMRAAFRTLGLDVPYVVDRDRRLAEALGVYSTPQAAILDAGSRLYYVGNYNRTRYCRDRDTEYARLALEALLAGVPPSAAIDGGPAYGCPLRRPAEAGI